MWPAQGYGVPTYGYADVRDVRGRRREESSESRGRHRRRRRDEDADDDRRDRRDTPKAEKKAKKEPKRGDREDGSSRRDEKGRDAGREGTGRDAGRESGRRGSGDVDASDRTARDGDRGRRSSAAVSQDDAQRKEKSAGGGDKEKEKDKDKDREVSKKKKKDEEAPPAEPEPKKSKNWREEQQENEEDERDLSTDDEGAEKKLAEARRRREALAAKLALEKKKKEEDDAADGGDGGSERKLSGDDGTGSTQGSQDAKGAPEKSGKSEAKEAAPVKKKVEEGANEGGSMFDDSKEAGEQLRKGMSHRSQNIGLTGASGDDWDDEEGYYIPKIGEVMGDRYLVVETSGGKGVFSNVVKAKDQQDSENQMVAIKILRANDMMTKAAEKETEILERLNAPENAPRDPRKRPVQTHCVRLLDTFAYRRHFCLVFECMADDLRAALKKYTKNKGMALKAVKAYTTQLFIGLKNMSNAKIIHADIKPDNILINKAHDMVKFCDLGTAVELKDVSVSPYLASRFYRAPEIILGCEYNQSVDTWALACTLYELFTGKVLFSSKSNNDHLKKIMEYKGKIPVKVIKKGAVWKNHFTDEMDFKHVVEFTPSGEPVTKTVTNLTATKSIKDLIIERVGPEKRQSADREDQEYVKKATQFADLLEMMLQLDPDKRVKPDDAFSHPFLQESKKPGDKK